MADDNIRRFPFGMICDVQAFKVCILEMVLNFEWQSVNINSRHSKSNFAHHKERSKNNNTYIVIHWLLFSRSLKVYIITDKKQTNKQTPQQTNTPTNKQTKQNKKTKQKQNKTKTKTENKTKRNKGKTVYFRWINLGVG